MGIKIYVFFICMILFYSYKFLKMGIQGNEIYFFTCDFKVCPRIFLGFLKFCPKTLHNTLLSDSVTLVKTKFKYATGIRRFLGIKLLPTY